MSYFLGNDATSNKRVLFRWLFSSSQPLSWCFFSYKKLNIAVFVLTNDKPYPVVQCSNTDDCALIRKRLCTDTRLNQNHSCTQIEISYLFTASQSSANLPRFIDFRPIGVASPIRETYYDPFACLPCFIFVFLLPS
jgi:hypothetical protein